MKVTKTASLVVFAVFANPALAAPEHAPHPGGIAVIEVAPGDAPRPIVEFGERRVLVTRDGDRWVAAVGVPLDAEIGEASIRVNTARDVTFDVREHQYEEQRLTIKNKSYVTPSEEHLARIGNERKIIDAALTSFRDQDDVDVALDCTRRWSPQLIFRLAALTSTTSRDRRTRAWISLRRKARRLLHRAPALSRRPVTTFSMAKR